MLRTIVVALALLALAATPPTVARAQSYNAKTITMIVNYPAGGPTDLEARIVAKHLPAHIPGNPAIVVKDVGGAGGIVGSNELGQAAPNGDTIGFFECTSAQILHRPPPWLCPADDMDAPAECRRRSARPAWRSCD